MRILRETFHDLVETVIHAQANPVKSHPSVAVETSALQLHGQPDVVDDGVFDRAVASDRFIGFAPDQSEGSPAGREPCPPYERKKRREIDERRHGDDGHEELFPETLPLEVR